MSSAERAVPGIPSAGVDRAPRATGAGRVALAEPLRGLLFDRHERAIEVAVSLALRGYYAQIDLTIPFGVVTDAPPIEILAACNE